MENIFESFVRCTTFNKSPLNTRYRAGSGGREGGLNVQKKKKRILTMKSRRFPFSVSGDFLKTDYENEGEG